MSTLFVKSKSGKLVKFGSKFVSKKSETTDTPLCFTAVENTDIGFTIVGTLTTTPTLEYKTSNNDVWTPYTFGTTISLTTGEKCYFQGDNSSFSESSSNYINFTSTNKVSASGNIMSLLDKTMKSKTISSNYCFTHLFKNCTSLTTAPELPAKGALLECYYQMFYNCTSLTTAPSSLPATTLSDYCYQEMFRGCTSLENAPKIAATTLAPYCCHRMFYGCQSLISLPALYATTMANYCYYYMFFNCANIKLSATQTGEYQNAYRIPVSGTGVKASYMLTNMFTGTGGTFAKTPALNTTYYTSNEVVE